MLLGGLLGDHAVAGDPETSLYAVGAAALDEPLVHLEMLELRSPLSRHLGLGGALGRLSVDDSFDELQLRAQLTISGATGSWTFENRNLVTYGEHTDLRFRGRLRAIRGQLFDTKSLSLRAYDELYVDLEGSGWIRNVVALGLGWQPTPAITAELYHAWSQERRIADTHYLLLVLSFRIDQ
jgi:hypothetical protein